MTLKTLTATAAFVMTLAVVPSLSVAMGCSTSHSATEQAMSCAEGTMFDDTTGTCIPVVTG